MRINVAVPEAHVTAPVLNSALEAVTRLNEEMLAGQEIPTFDKGLHYGIKWKPEPPGAEHFDHAKTVLNRKWGDCDDLAPWHAASLRHTGEDPHAQAVARKSGPNRWHAVVQRSDGSIDDPSKRAGMGQPQQLLGAVLPVMYGPASVVGGAYIIRPQIALRPVRGAMQARADLPWYWREHLDDKPTPTDIAITALHTAPTAATALTGAIDGLCEMAACGGWAVEPDLNRLSAISDLLSGVPVSQIHGIYGSEDAEAARAIVGSFWSHLRHFASPFVDIAKQAVPFIPGVGPIAAKGIEFAEHMFPGGAAVEPGGGGGAPGGGRGMHCAFF